MNPHLRCLASLALLLCSLVAHAGGLLVDTDDVQGKTGKYLTGIHFVYSDEKDSIYRGDAFARWARSAGIATARFPGGTVVKYWDWKNPTGLIKEDAWDRKNDQRANPAEWMSIDEYLHFVEVSGVRPLIGVNLLSGVKYDRVDDSVKRAAEQVRYVVSRGHKGAFYYLGNEDMGLIGGIEAHARVFLRHAREIKRVDPTARLLWNDNSVNPKRLGTFLEIAGEHADGVEFHGKWPYGGDKLKHMVRVADWQAQMPFRDENRGSYSERALALRAAARKLGRADLIIANNEYGLAQFRKDRFVGFDRYQYSLVAIEFLQDLFIGQFDMAAFWSNVAAGSSGGTNREMKRLIDTTAGNRLNPMHLGLELLASAQGRTLLEVRNGGPAGYGFATLGEDALQVFLLNKTGRANTVTLRFEGKHRVRPEARVVSLVDTLDHWGKLQESVARMQDAGLQLTLPALSYSRISLACCGSGAR